MNTSNRRIPNLNEGDVLLFENPDGFQGFGNFEGQTHRLRLTRKVTNRCTVFTVTAHEPDSATWLGDVFETDNPGVIGKSGKPVPELIGYLNASGNAEMQLRFAVWRRVSRNGVTHLFGSIRPVMAASPADKQSIASHGPNGSLGAALTEPRA